MVRDTGDARSVWTAARSPPPWARRAVVVKSPVHLVLKSEDKKEGVENLQRPHPVLITPDVHSHVVKWDRLREL